jgi:hypothetical protein
VLAIARRRAAASGVSVELLLGSATAIPLADNAVLKPNGNLYFVEHGLSPEPSVEHWQHRISKVKLAIRGNGGTARADTETNKPARMAALGIHHTSMLVCTLPSQSREVWIGVLVIACYAQKQAAPGSPPRTA